LLRLKQERERKVISGKRRGEGRGESRSGAEARAWARAEEKAKMQTEATQRMIEEIVAEARAYLGAGLAEDAVGGCGCHTGLLKKSAVGQHQGSHSLR
jgi:hypothetical protein